MEDNDNVILSAANTYTGATTITTSGGKLQVGNNGTSGQLGVNGSTYSAVGLGSSGATVSFKRTDNITVSNTISGSANFTLSQDGSGSTTLAGGADNAFAQGTVNAGTLVLGKGSSSSVHALGGGTETVNIGGTLQLGGAGGDQIADGAGVTVNSGGAFDLNGQTETISSLSLNGTGIGGLGALTNSSSSAAILTLNNGGVIAGATTLGGAGNIGIYGAGAISNATTITYLTKIGANTLTLASGSGVDNLNVHVIVNSGTVILAKTNTTSSPSVHATGQVTINTGATVQLGGSGGYEIYDGQNSTNNGGVLDLNGQNQAFTGTGSLLVSGNGVGSGGALINSSGTASTVTGTVTLGGNASMGGSGNLTLASALGDGGSGYGLTKVGGGALTLQGTNTYAGATTVSAGTLTIGGAGQLGGGSYSALITNNAALNYASSAAQTLSGIISGTGSLTNAGSGTLTLSGANTYSGATTISTGALQLGNANAAQNSTVSIGVANGLTFSSGIGGFNVGALSGSANETLLDTASGAVALKAGSNNASTTFSGVLSGTGSLTKTGTGTQTLAGTNALSGITTVNAGTLVISGTNMGSSTMVVNQGGTLVGDLTVNAGGVFNPSSAVTLAGGTLNIKGKSSGTSATALGSLTLNPGNSTITITNNGGSGTTLTLGNTWTANPGGYLLVDLSPANSGTLASSPALTGGIIGGYALVKDANGIGFATVSGGNVVRFTGATYLTTAVAATDLTSTTDYVETNSVTLTGSLATQTLNSLEITNSCQLWLGTKTLVVGSGGILFHGPGFCSISGNAGCQVTSGGSVLNVYAGTAGDNQQIYIPIVDNGGTKVGLTLSGPGNFFNSGANTYSGDTVVNGGNLKANVNHIPYGAGKGNLVVNSGGTADLGGGSGQINGLTQSANNAGGSIANSFGGACSLTVGNADTNASFAGVISGSGANALSIIKTGAGTQTLTGVNTYGGSTTISAGTLALSGSGSIASSTNIAIAAGATLDVSGLAASGFTFTGSSPQQTLAGRSSSGTANLNATGKTVTLNSSALLAFQANGGLSGTVGQISVAGNLTLNANAITINLAGGVLPVGNYTLLSCTGTLATNGSFAAPTFIGTQGTVASIVVNAGSGGSVVLQVTAVPGANTYWWSGNGGSTLGGGGTWDTTSTNWSTNGSSAWTTWPNGGGDTALFTNTAGTVTNATTINLSMLRIQTNNGWVFNGGTLNFGTNAGSIVMSNNNSTTYAQINSALSGSGTLTVAEDTGWQQGIKLYGNNTNFTGNLVLTNAGSHYTWLNITNDFNLGAVPASYTSNALTFYGGAVESGTAAPIIIATNRGIYVPVGPPTLLSGSWILNSRITGPATGSAGFAIRQATAVINCSSNDFANDFWPDGATVIMGVDNGLPHGSGKGNLNFSDYDGVSTVNLNGHTLTINGLTGRATTGNFLSSKIDNTNASAATLVLGDNNANGNTFYGIITNSGGALSLTKIGTGTQTLSGTNSYSGGTTISNGTLAIGSAGQLGSGTYSAAITNNSAFNYNSSAAQTLSGIISGSGSLTNSGTGTLTLSGTNTYSGATAVNMGTLKAGSTNGLSPNSAFDVAAGATLDLAGFTNTIGSLGVDTATSLITNSTGAALLKVSTALGSTACAQLFGGNLGLQIFGGGNTTILGNPNSTYSGGTILGNGLGTGNTRWLSSGTIGTGSPGAVTSGYFGTGTITIGASTTDKSQIYCSGATTINNAIVVNTILGDGDFGAFRLETGPLTINGTINANLADVGFDAQNGSSQRTATVTNTISGNSGLQVLAQSSALITVLLANTGTANSYAGNTAIDSAAATLTCGAANQIPYGAGKGNLLITNGTFNLGGFNQTLNGLSGSGTVDGVSGTPTLTVGSNNVSSTYSGVIKNTAGTLALTKVGAGTLTLSGSNTYSGATIITNGTLLAGSTNGLSPYSAFDVAAGATLDLAGFTNTIGSLGVDTATSLITNSTGAALLKVSTALGSTACAQLFGGNLGLQIYGGGNTTILGNNNSTYSGGTILGNGSGGAIRAFASGTIGTGSPGAVTSGYYGTGPITFGAATTDKPQFYVTGTATINNAIVVNSALGDGTYFGAFRLESGPLTVAGTINANLADVVFEGNNGTSSRTATVTGQITGNSGLQVLPQSSALVNVTLNNTGTANSYAGNTAIDSANATLTCGAANQIPYGAGKGNLLITNGTFNLGGFNQTLNGLSGSGIVDGVSGTPSLTVGSNNVTSTFSGVIENTAGTLALTKVGTGALSLSGSNTFSGGVYLNGGTLNANNANALGTGTVYAGGGQLTLGANTVSYTNNLALNNTNLTINLGSSDYLGNSGSWLTSSGTSATLILGTTGTHTVYFGNGTSQILTNFSGTILANNAITTLNLGSGNLNLTNAMVVLTNSTLLSFGFNNESAQIGSLNGGASSSLGGYSGTFYLGYLGLNDTFAGTIANGSAGAISLVKAGAGMLTLSGTNTYAGITTVGSGELMGVTGSSCSNSAVTVYSGATNGVQLATSGGVWYCTNLTDRTGSAVDLNFGGFTPNATIAPLQVLNGLNITNPTIIVRNVSGGALAAGRYPLIQAGGVLNGSVSGSTLVLPTLPAGGFAAVVKNTANNSIDLVVTSTNLTWAVGSGNWDFTTANWASGGVSGFYYADGTAVVLDNSASGTGTILVTNLVSVSPSSVTASNTATKSYVIYGGAMAGSMALTNAGSGTLTLANTNTYLGGTYVSGGALQLGDNATQAGQVAGGITDNAGLILAEPTAQTITNVIAGSGTVNNVGAGAVTLTGVNTFSGGLYINSGTINANNTTALSSGTVYLGATNGSANATLTLSGSSGTWTNAIVVTNGNTGVETINNSGNVSYVLGGPVTLANNLTFVATGTSGTIKLTNGINGINGSSLITVTNDGAAVSASQYVDLTGANSGFTGNVAVNGGMLRLEGATALSSANIVQLNYANTMLNLNATASLTLAGLAGVAGGIVTNTSGAGRTLTLAGAGQYAFNGAILDANTTATRISLTFTGTGTNIFGGTNTYSGATLVTNGTLLVNGWNLGTNTVTVTNAGTAFGGTGVISGPVTFYAGTFAHFSLGAPLGFSNSLTIAASGVRPQVEVTLTNNTPPGTYVLATNASASGSFSNTPVIIGGSLARPNYTATIQTTATNVVLVVGAIPTTTALTATPNPSVYGGSVVFTATVQTNSLTVTNAAGDATGGFIFSVDGSAAATNSLAGGVASFTSSTLTAGSHVIQAFYAGDANYSATSNSVTQTVSPRPVILAGTRVYDGTAVATNLILTITNYVGADNLSLSNALTGYAGLAGAGVGTNLITATNNLSLAGTGVATNYTLTGSSGSVVITAASLVITASNTNKMYGQALTLTGFTTAGLAAGDTVTSVSLTSSGAANTATVGSYGIAAAGAAGSGLANYSISYVPGTLTVNPLVAVLSGKRAYDGTTNAPGANLTVTNFVNSDVVTLGGTGGLASAYVGTNAITSLGSLSLSGGAGTNYTLAGATGLMIITNTPLTITANNASKTYDGTGYTGGNGVTYAGFVNGETNTALTGSLSYGGLAQGATNAGTYNLTPGGYSSTNYLISYVDGTLTISPLAVTVTAYPQTKVYGSADPALTYTNSPALVAGDGFTGALSRVAGEAVGSYAINQGGLGLSANYSLIYVGTNLTITVAPLTVTANSTSKVYGQNLVFAGTEFTAAGLTNGDTISSVVLTSSGATNTATVGSYDIVATGAAGSSGLTNYTIGYSNGTLTVTQATPTNTLASSVNPSGFHDTVTFTNTLNADATGYVLLSTNSVLWSSNNLSGGVAVSLSITNLPRGTNLITAAYSGDTNYVAGSITLNQIVTNHPPAANTATYSRGAFTTWQIAVSALLTNASDADSDALTLVGMGTSTNGITLVVNTNSPARVQYYNTNLVADQFTFTVADGYGGTNSAVITLSATGGGVTGTSSITTITGTGVKVLTAYGIPGYTYVTQRATNLSQVTWLNLATNTLATNAVIISVTDSNPPSPSAYYRLLWSGH